MRSIDLSQTTVSLSEALTLAENDNIVLRTSEGREFVLAQLDDFDREIALTSGNAELMKLLDDRSQQAGRLSLDEVRRQIR